MGFGPFHLGGSDSVVTGLCGFCGRQSATGTDFSLLQFSPVIFILPVLHAYSYVTDAIQQLAASLNNTL